MDHTSSWVHHIPYLGAYPEHVVIVGLSTLCVGCLGGVIYHQARRRYVDVFSRNSVDCTALVQGPLELLEKSFIVPSEKLSLVTFAEWFAASVYHALEDLLGSKLAREHAPMVGSLFVMTFLWNVIGLIPGFPSATANINTTVALGVFSFLYYNGVGFQSAGWGYLKHFLGPVVWLSPLMLMIELISHVFRPFSLALRLQGNMLCDHIVLDTFSQMVPYVVPIVFYVLGIFVSLVQAFVLSVMSAVYILLATEHGDEH